MAISRLFLFSSIAPVMVLASFVQATTAPQASQRMGPGTSAHPIAWGPCPVTVGSSLSCGFLEVPIDYHDPSAGNGRVAVVKANATGERLGTVFVNPGGPGVSGVDSLAGIAPILFDYTGGGYDVVSWDPRGVGSSTPGPVSCFESTDEYTAFFNGTIELTGIEWTGTFADSADVAALYAQAESMQAKYVETGQRCRADPNGRYLQYMGTAATVRDLIRLADAIEGPGNPINYIGYSYGTFLGGWFVNRQSSSSPRVLAQHLYIRGRESQRVGKVVLDGVTDPGVFSDTDLSLGWSAEFTDTDKVYEGLVIACALAGPEKCAIAQEGDSPEDVHATIQAAINAAHDSARADPAFPVKSGIIRYAMVTPMYGAAAWPGATNSLLPELMAAIQEQRAPNATLVDSYLVRSPYAQVAINCADTRDATAGVGMEDIFAAAVNATRNVSHMFGAVWPVPAYYCETWPARAVERYTGPFNKTLASRILVVGNTYDPVTPFWQAETLARRFGDRAALVRMDGFGHSSLAASSSCIRAVVRAYMVNGTLPEGQGTVCDVDDAFEIYPGVTTKDVLAHMPEGGLEWES
ncbi:TAP-like protein-domain-containing protein [Daedaleopsis nitida]|nr:TAP-like protein-domain-containing protein [Daedaleopsis nitida]